MIKKLVKYGNSTALVLDKAILELLNMSEGGSVKITTDGKSLILSPVVLNTPIESHGVVPMEIKKPIVNAIDPDKAIQGALSEVNGMNDPKKQAAMAKLAMVSMQRQFILKKLYANELFVRDLALIDPSDTQRVCDLMYSFEPELKAFNNDLIEAGKVLEPEKSALQILDEANKAFVFFNDKGNEYFSSFATIQNDPEYRNELALITEEYEQTKDHKAYVKAYGEITRRYIPVMEGLIPAKVD